MADAGLKIGVEGEREFKKALSGINEEMKLLGSEMKLVASEFDANDKSVKALKSQYNVMSSEVDTQRKKVDTLKDALAAASTEFGENDKRTQSWKKQLNLATAELNKMENGLDDLKDELNDARMPSARLGEAIDGIKEKFSDFMKWPKRIGNELKTLTTPIAKVGSGALTLGKNLASVGKTVAGFTLKGIGTAAVAGGAALAGLATAAISAANNVAAAGDQIDKESQKLNMSREAYQEWSYVLSQNGADIAQLGSGMEALVDKMKAAGEGSEEVSGMFGELGISMDAVKSATPEEAFEMVVRGLQGMTDETRKAQIAQELLGGSGAELMPLLNSTAEATEKLKQEAHDLGMVMSDDAVDAAVKYTDSVDKMKRVGTALFQNITSELLPGFTMIADGLVGLATGQKDATSKIKDGVKDIVENVREMLPMVLDVIREVLPLLVTAIVESLPLLIETFTEVGGELATTLVEALKESWPAIKEAGLELVHGLWEGIKGAGAWLWEQLSGWASGIVGDIKDFFGIQSPSKVFAGIGGYLAEGLGVGFEKEMDAVSRQMRDAVPMSFDTSIDARLRTTAYGAERGAYMERGFARNGYPSQQTIVLQVGEREFGRIVVDASEKEYVRRDMKVVTR